MSRALPLIFLSFSLLGGAYLAGSLSLSMGTVEQPGAGLFPMLVGIFILFLSIPGLVGSLKSGETRKLSQGVFPQGSDLRRVIAIALSVLLFAILLQPLGYGICSAFLMAAVLRLLGMRSWGKAAVIAILTAGISYFFFVLLDIPLPRGSLFP
jgi:putative tricarboxylic transport membrane protein